MESSPALLAQLRTIVELEYPAEIDVFDLHADALVREALSDGKSARTRVPKHMEAGNSWEIVEHVALVVSILKSLVELARMAHHTTPAANTAAALEEAMKREGIPPEVAKRIAERHAESLLQSTERRPR